MERVNKVVNVHKLSDIEIMVDELLELVELVISEVKFTDRQEDIVKLKSHIENMKNDYDGDINIFLEETFLSAFKDIKEELKKAQINNNTAISNIPAKEPLIALKTKYPDEFIGTIDKISNKLFSGELANEARGFRMEKLGAKNKLTATVSLDFDDIKDNIYTPKDFDIYDWEVHNAIITLYVEAKVNVMNPTMIFRAMTYNPKARITPKARGEILESIDKLSNATLYIDSTEEANGKGYNFESLIFKERIIYTRSAEGILNGQKGEVIEIITTPVLYRYANSKNQISRTSIEVLKTPINKNRENIMLQSYLKKRIDIIKRGKLHRNIRYDTICDNIGINLEDFANPRAKKSNVVENTETLLKHWINIGYIEDYKNNKANTYDSIESVTIIP